MATKSYQHLHIMLNHCPGETENPIAPRQWWNPPHPPFLNIQLPGDLMISFGRNHEKYWGLTCDSSSPKELDTQSSNPSWPPGIKVQCRGAQPGCRPRPEPGSRQLCGIPANGCQDENAFVNHFHTASPITTQTLISKGWELYEQRRLSLFWQSPGLKLVKITETGVAAKPWPPPSHKTLSRKQLQCHVWKASPLWMLVLWLLPASLTDISVACCLPSSWCNF